MTNATMKGLLEELENAPTVEVERNRYGYTVDGERLRRVTTLLRGIPKDWMGNWVAKMVAEYAYDNHDAWRTLDRTNAVKLLKGVPWSKRDDAADRGTAIHNALEAFVRKETLPEMSAEERACADAACAFLAERGDRILAAELTVLNRTIGYAGTLDLWTRRRDGTSWIYDYKSSSGIYAEHAVQQVAYLKAEYAVVQKVTTGHEQWTGKLIPWEGLVDRLGVVHVEPGKATLYPIKDEMVERLWTVFRAVALIKEWLLATDSYAGRVPREAVYDEPTSVEPE